MFNRRSRERIVAAGIGLVTLQLSSGIISAQPPLPVELIVAASPLSKPIGIDTHEPTNSIIVSINYPTGIPANFLRILSSGSEVFGPGIRGLTNEVKIGSIRAGSCQGNFPTGTLFTSTGLPGQVQRIAADASSSNLFVILGNVVGLPTGIFQDRFCAAGGDLLVVTSAGYAYRVGANAFSSMIASVGTPLQGVTSVPDDPRYGPMAGTIIAGAPLLGRIYIFDIDSTTGAISSTYIDNIVPVEDIDIVPPNENFFVVDYGTGRVFGAPAAAFADKVGDIVLTQELPNVGGAFYGIHVLRWNPDTAVFDAFPISTGAGADSIVQLEHATFSRAGSGPIAPANNPVLSLTSYVVNDNGGMANATDWTVEANGPTLISGAGSVAAVVDPGTYTLSEIPAATPGYAFEGWQCSLNGGVAFVPASDQIAVGLNDSASCTATNNDIAPTLTISKVLTPTTDAGRFNLRIDDITHAVGIGDGGTTGAVQVTANEALVVSETAVAPAELDDYVSTITGDCDASGNIILDLDQESACTITNVRKAEVSVSKTTNGAIDPSLDFGFALYDGPDGFGGTILGSATTFGDNDGYLTFGDALLIPGQTYTVCELGTPAGWSADWIFDGSIVGPYNPGSDDPTPQDIGDRCHDFVAAPGALHEIAVDNIPPIGGDAHSGGYWRNWNACTPGGQAEAAARNGGPAAGFFLVDDVLPQTIGSAQISDCETAVSVLLQRDTVSDRVRASDAAYALAARLLAYKFNIAAGAATCYIAANAAVNAELLLSSVSYSTTGAYLPPAGDAALRAEAQALTQTLDSYNENTLCAP